MNGKIVFFGTSKICIEYLQNLNNFFKICLIITTPDSKGGRKRTTICPPVKQFALENNITHIQPSILRSRKLKELLLDLKPDLGVVISYGKFIPSSIINCFKKKIINVHFSLLPKYRGAAPVQRAIENGEATSGITIFEINKKMDEGDIYTQVKFPIPFGFNSTALFDKLCELSQTPLIETVNEILNNHDIKKHPQNHDDSSYAPPIIKNEGLIDWNLNGNDIYHKFLAFSPWPSIYCYINKKTFKLTNIKITSENHDFEPGTVIKIDKESMQIACKNNSVIEIKEFQPPGKKPMSPFTFSLGNSLPKNLCS